MLSVYSIADETANAAPSPRPSPADGRGVPILLLSPGFA
jgi:hypothetical protein